MITGLSWRLPLVVVVAAVSAWPGTAQANTIGGFAGRPRLPGAGSVDPPLDCPGPIGTCVDSDWVASAWNCYRENWGGVQTVPAANGESCNASYWEIPLPLDGAAYYQPVVNFWNATGKTNVTCGLAVVGPNAMVDTGMQGAPLSGPPYYRPGLQPTGAGVITFTDESIPSGPVHAYVYCSLPDLYDEIDSVAWVAGPPPPPPPIQ